MVPCIASERYAHEAASIQNGTHTEIVVPNPLHSILADLESEVQDVVIGFETRLRRIKREGERAFNNHSNGVTQKEEEKGSNAVKLDPEISIPSHGQFVPSVGSQEQVLGKVEPVGKAEDVVGGSNVNAGEAVPRLSENGRWRRD